MIEGQIPIEEYETGNTKHTWDLKKIRFAHRILAEYNYKKGDVKKGYADRTLYVNLSNKEKEQRTFLFKGIPKRVIFNTLINH